MIIRIQNDTKRYTNQYHDVIDIPEIYGDEKVRTCNISCVSMIVDENVNDILKNFITTYGNNRKYQWEELLVKYMQDRGHTCTAMTKTAYPDARQITDDELKIMMQEIRKGNIIFYHKKGHYELMIGFEVDEKGKMLNFIFNDPAGNRKYSKNIRTRESGHTVCYPYSMIKDELIYGKCWSVTL